MDGRANVGRGASRDDNLARMQVSIPTEVLHAVGVLACKEDRSISSMARILLAEALAARAEDMSA